MLISHISLVLNPRNLRVLDLRNLREIVQLHCCFGGFKNLSEFIPLADRWIVADNSNNTVSIIADGKSNVDIAVHYPELWAKIKMMQ